MSKKGTCLGVGTLIFISLWAVILLSPFTVVNAGHRGVVTNFGKVKDKVLGEGFHIVSPFDSVHEFDVRTQKIEVDADSASKDLQAITTRVAINYRINAELVRSLYQETSGRFDETLIAPAIQESVKAATAGFTAEELITNRASVKDAIVQFLRERDNLRFFVIEDVSIVDFSFSESFNASIEKKVTAEQDALAAKNKLEQTKYEAEQRIVQAQAEAESIRIQAEALRGNEDLVELEAVRKWNGVLPHYTGGSIPFINVTQ